MTTALTDQIEKVEQLRTEALVKADVEALSRILADDFAYVHSSGRLEERDSYLSVLASGAHRWIEFGHEDTVVRPYGATTLVHGVLTGAVESGGSVHTIRFRYVALWVEHDGSWQLAFWQNTKPQS